MTKSFTLAHLSDVHLGPLPPMPLAYLNLKRMLGYLNWHYSRKQVHIPGAVEALIADLRQQAVDHITVTGDLINIGLPREYERAAGFLQRVGPPSFVSLVPGNHDIYTTLRDHEGVELWRSYMAGEHAGEAEAARPAGFPYVRRFDELALIGVNSAVPTRPFHAGGLVGPKQLGELERVLDVLGGENVCRVVLIHHPPLPGQATPAKALADAVDLAAILRSSGCELVLHGHNHTFTIAHSDGPNGRIPVVGVPSASLGHVHKSETLARYHIFEFQLDRGPTRIELIARGLRSKDGGVTEIGRWRLDPA